MNSPVRNPAIAAKAFERLPKTLKLGIGSSAPVFEGMLQIIRNSGYTIGTSALELTDNSIDAGAKTVKIHVHSEDKLTQRIVTIDFGRGMDSPKLQRGWQMAGGAKTDRAEGAIGKFDIGMKGATLSMCKNITIASREENGSITCLFADTDTMRAVNRFEPTEFVEDANPDHLLKYFHPTDIETFLSEPSGTIVQMKTFLPEMVSHVDTTVSELRSAISGAYPHHHAVRFFIKQDDEDEFEVEKLDMFYSGSPTSVRFSYTTEIAVYQPDRCGAPLRLIEMVKETRSWFNGGKAGRGTMVAGRFYEHSEIPKHGSSYRGSESEISTAEIEKLKPKLIGVMKIRVVQVTDETYKTEPDDVDAKGFHMRRGIRNVGSSMRLGYKFHDRASHAADRQRMEIEFTPAMDKAMGSTWNKTMRDGPLPQKVVGDTLIRIYKQVTSEWTRQTDREIAALATEDAEISTDSSSVQESSEDEEEESRAYIPQPKTFADIAQFKTPVAKSPFVEPTPSRSLPPIVPSPSEPSSPVESTTAPEHVSGLEDSVRELLALLSGKTLCPRDSTLETALKLYLETTD
jgi:hypothetical protein